MKILIIKAISSETLRLESQLVCLADGRPFREDARDGLHLNFVIHLLK